MPARHQPALRIEDLGVEAGVHPDGDALPCPCTTTLNGAFPGSTCVATVNTSPGRIQ
jgi:hypothetical protein